MIPLARALALITLTVLALAAALTTDAGSPQLTLTYGVSVEFLMAANMGTPDHARASGSGSVSVTVVGSSANVTSIVRLDIDARELLGLFSSLNRSWSEALTPGELITLNETGMNAFLRKVVKEARPGLVIERAVHMSRWGDRPALELRVRVYNNESRPEYLMLYRVSINGTYWYDIGTGYLLESVIKYWVITSQGPMQVYMNGSAHYRLQNPEVLPGPGKAKTYWFSVGGDLGKLIVSWEGSGEPEARVDGGDILISGGASSKLISVAVLSPHEPRIVVGGESIEPVTYPLNPPWGSFTITPLGGGEARIVFDEGVSSVSDSPPGGGPPYLLAAVGAGAAALALGGYLVVRKRRG